MERTESAKISMLMECPHYAASILVGIDVFKANESVFIYHATLMVVISFLFAFITIKLMMRLLQRIFHVYICDLPRRSALVSFAINVFRL